MNIYKGISKNIDFPAFCYFYLALCPAQRGREPKEKMVLEGCHKRKDGRFEGRIPLEYDDNGKIKHRYLYTKSLFELKGKMLCAYADLSNSTQNICNKIFMELLHEWFSSAKLHVKHSSYCCYEKLIAKHIIPYFRSI